MPHARAPAPAQAASVSRLLSETFCALIFRAHFVHCDPHPGNILVRVRPPARPGARPQPQLVLLDHGLYRELPPRFVHLYAELWRAIVVGDADGIREVSISLGVGEYYPLLAAMLTGRPWGEILSTDGGTERLMGRGTAEDKAQISGYAQQYLREIVLVLERVPPPMLLLFKCNDCLRHAERQLSAGASTGVDSFLTTLRFCVHAALDYHALADEATSVTQAVRSRLRRLRLRLVLWLLSTFQDSHLGPRLISRVLGASGGAAAR